MDLHEANQRLAGGGEKAGQPVTPAESQFATAQTKEIEKQKMTIEEQRKKIEEIRNDLESKDKERGDLELKVKALEEQVSLQAGPAGFRRGNCYLQRGDRFLINLKHHVEH